MSFKSGIDSLITWAKRSRKPAYAPGRVGKFLDTASGNEVHETAMRHLKTPEAQKKFSDAKTRVEQEALFSNDPAAMAEYKTARKRQDWHRAGAAGVAATGVVGLGAGIGHAVKKRREENAILDYYRSQGIEV